MFKIVCGFIKALSTDRTEVRKTKGSDYVCGLNLLHGFVQ